MRRILNIYYTSDTHGHLFPSGDGRGGSMLQCFHKFKKDGNTLILDGGDTIQGSPLIKFLREKGRLEEVLSRAFDEAGYDYFTLGNHDFNYGREKLKDFLKAMGARCLAANVKDIRGELPVRAWTVHTLENGLRVGICGAVTDCVNLWEAKENLEDLQVTDAFEAVKQALEEMKRECDVTVCIYHGGYERDLETGEVLCQGKENMACQMLSRLDFDLLLTAHQHMETEGREINGTYTLQLPPNGEKYARVEVTVDDGGESGPAAGKAEERLSGDALAAGMPGDRLPEEPDKNRAGGSGRKTEISARLVSPGKEISPSLMKELEPVRREEEVWKERVIGTLAQEIPAQELLERAMNGTALADLGNQVQLWITGADMACIGMANVPVGLGRQVKLGDMLRVYPFPNRQVVLTVTGEILKAALERCASYFDLEDGKVVISQRFTKPKEEHYNYDYYAGVEYTADLRRPVGERVTEILVKGRPAEMEKTYTLAMSDYRATGTGGYECFRSCPPPRAYPGDMQSSIISYLESHPEAEIKPLGKLHLIY